MRRQAVAFLGVALLSTLLVLGCLCASFVTVNRPWQALGLFARAATATAVNAPTPGALATATVAASPSSGASVTKLPPTPVTTATPAPDTAKILADIQVPPRNSRLLAGRLRPGTDPIPEVVNPTPPRYAVGDKARFWVSDTDTGESVPITATLRVISEHTTMWVQDGLSYSQRGLEQSAKNFDERIYPTVHRYFGTEWSPGVDNDPRIVILNTHQMGAAGGYFSSHDEYSRRVNPYSNEQEMFYMNIDDARPGTSRYELVLAHEFQHMVHWYMDGNEDGWVNEGASELSVELTGYGASETLQSFAQNPDIQLNNWPAQHEEAIAHYGASYLWMSYFLQRFGPDTLKALIAEPANGIEGFEKVLQGLPGAPSFDEVFADWVVANLLDDPSLEDGRYGHQVANPHLSIDRSPRGLPVQQSATVSQYGTDYIALPAYNGTLRLEFQGQTVVPVVPNQPRSGHYQWWSNRSDEGDTTLTRSFDLSGLRKATLQYALWYQLEEGWDYGYVEVSVDGGQNWIVLTTPHTTGHDPAGNAFGPGYTGYSGHPPGGKAPLEGQWVNESIDLSPYVGQRILIRFEMVTDDIVNLPGMCIDDISIPELGFKDDAERDDNGWQADGFVRMDNQLPQHYLVQVIHQGKQPRVERVQLDAQQHGTLLLENPGANGERVVLAISGATPYTTEVARYSYNLAPYTP